MLSIRLKSLVQNPPWKAWGREALVSLGTLWLVLELSSWALPNIYDDILKIYALTGASIISFIWATYRSIPPVQYKKRFKSRSTTIELRVDDLIENAKSRHIGILSSNYFDSCTNTAISAHSLKGKLITSYYSGLMASFDSAVDQSLNKNGIVGVENPGKQRGVNRLRRYEIGTVAAVPVGSFKAILVVGAEFEDSSSFTSTNAMGFWASLLALWRGAQLEGHRQPIAVPIWGANLGNAPGSRLVKFQTLLCSFAVASAAANQPPTTDLHIVVWKGDYDPEEFRTMAEVLSEFEM